MRWRHSQFILYEAARLAHAEPNVSAWWAAFLNWAESSIVIKILSEEAITRYGVTVGRDLIRLHKALRDEPCEDTNTVTKED